MISYVLLKLNGPATEASARCDDSKKTGLHDDDVRAMFLSMNHERGELCDVWFRDENNKIQFVFNAKLRKHMRFVCSKSIHEHKELAKQKKYLEDNGL
jgi:hypothetical protein